ncbi:hypothetical protein D3C72_1096140 [compost metagenome]
MPGLGASQRRADRQIVVRHLGHRQGAPFGGDLPQQALARTEALRDRRVGGNAECRDTPEYAALALEEGGGLNIGVARQIGEDAGRQLFYGLIAHHGVRQPHLALVDPLLAGPLTRAAPDKGVDAQGQGCAKEPGQDSADQGCAIGGVHLLEAR